MGRVVFFFLIFCAQLVIASAIQPASTSKQDPCSTHRYWLERLVSYKSVDPTCQNQVEQVAQSIARGYRLCETMQTTPPSRAICSFKVDQYLRLRDVTDRQNQQQAKTDATDVVSQYKGTLEGMDKNQSSCLNHFSGFRRDLSCNLGPEFGQLPPKSNWWSDFWNREQSEAPFSEIPAWAKMGISTVASALLWRYRGGGFNKNGSSSNSGMHRAVTALGYLGIGYFNGGMDGAITGAAMIPGLFVPYGEQMVMREGVNGVDASEQWRNFGYMTGLGALTTAAPSAYLYARGYDPTGMLLGGAAKGVCYFGSWNWAPRKLNFNMKSDFVGGVPTQSAELCSGAAIGAGMSYSLLYGKKDKKKPSKPTPEKCEVPASK